MRVGLVAARLGELQLLLREIRLEGWLLSDHRGQSPLAQRAIGLGARTPLERWLYWVPAGDGMPALVAHASEIEEFPELPGDQLSYTSFADLRTRLEKLVPTRGRVAMEHVEMGGAPDVARVDWGTVSLVKSGGCDIVSSLELVNAFLGPWTAEDVPLHAKAHALVGAALESSLGYLRSEREPTESGLATELRAALSRAGLDGPAPLVAAGDRTLSRVHGAPIPPRVIGPSTPVVLDVLGRLGAGPFAHRTFVVARKSADQSAIAAFERARAARDEAIDELRTRFEKHERTLGYEIDRMIAAALGRGKGGVKPRHRGGSHLGWIPWSGEACTFDDTEIHDPREALVGLAWSLHPGAYDVEVGVRAQATVRRTETGLEVIDPGQREIRILG